MEMSTQPVPDLPAQAIILNHFDGRQRTVYVTEDSYPYPAGQLLVAKVDAEGLIAFVNPAFVMLSGYEEDELLGFPPYIVRHPDMPKAVFEDLYKTLESGEKWQAYIKNLRKDGRYYWLYTTVIPTYRHGQWVGYTAVSRQPSAKQVAQMEEKYADMRARENGRRSETLHHYDGSERDVIVTGEACPFPEGQLLISRSDAKGVITYVNDAFLAMCGYQRHELIGQPHAIFRHPDTPKSVYKQLWATIGAGKRWHGFLQNLHKNGQHYWSHMTIVPHLSEGRISGFTAIRSEPCPAGLTEAKAIYQHLKAKELSQTLARPSQQVSEQQVKVG